MLTFTTHTIALAPRAPTVPRAPRGLVRRVIDALLALFGGRRAAHSRLDDRGGPRATADE